MKKTATRVIAIALVLLMAVALLPLGARAAGPYTVHFVKNAEDATGEMADQVSTEGNFTLSANAFRRAGFFFLNWSANPEGSAPCFPDGYELNMDALAAHVDENGVLTLYAQWTDKVNVRLLPNGGEGNASSLQTEQGQEFTVPENCFTREGYTFTGWLCSADGKVYAPGDTLTPTEPFSLTAQWTESVVYTLSFDPNGGEGSMAPMTGSANTFTLPACGFTYEGHTFQGWSVGPVAESVASLMLPGNSFTMNAAVTEAALYAQWAMEEYASYTVTFDPNGGSMQPPLARSVVRGQAIGELPVPKWDGYIFTGWYALGQRITASFLVEDNLALTARWVKDDSQNQPTSYTVHFNANGGSGTMADVTAPAGTPIKAPACTFTAPAGSSFTGWNTLANGSGGSYPVGSAIGFNAEFNETEKTLYAQWVSAAPAALIGTVTISGTANPGEVLTATLSDSNNSGTLSYQWLKNSSPISGETGQTYTVKNDDLQAMLSCRVESSVQTGSRTSAPVTVYPASKGTPGTSEPVPDNSFPENKIAALKKLFGDIPGIKTAVYQVDPCWNNNPNDKMSAEEIRENAPIVFMLPYPAGTAAGGYDFYVYHYNTSAEKAEPVDCVPGANSLVVSGTAFSPFILLAVPTAPTENSVLIGGTPVVGGTLSAICGDGVTPTAFQWTRGGKNILNAKAATYKVSAADVGYRICCDVTTASGKVIPSSNYVVPTEALSPEVTQGVYNDGETATGVISNVSKDMQYIYSGDYYNVSNPKWKDVTGTKITGLKKGGLYYIRLKDDPSVMVNVFVPSYYSVRVYEKVKDTRYVDKNGNSAPRHGTLSPKATVVEAGTTLSIEAKPNKNYAVYDVKVNGKSVDWTKAGNLYLIRAKDINKRTDVDVMFVYTGSSPRTGDDSHLALWCELAALSLAGLGAALTVLKKKRIL